MIGDLLSDSIFSIEKETGEQLRVTLPGYFALLSRNESIEPTSLQAHQQHAWHAFTVQLAATALLRSDAPEQRPRTEKAWRALLVDAARADGGDEGAFALVVSDVKRPAFLQPPIPSGKVEELKSEHHLPNGELDVLNTAKNHDVKVHRVVHASLEAWVYGLVTLQTMQGYFGAGNYGIARMNGGISSRPCVGFAPGQSTVARFNRDLSVLLEQHNELIAELPHKRGHRKALVWCVPWDGTKSLTLQELDPYFIEVCRRVRLINHNGGILARRGSSKCARVEASDLHGNTGDPWTPVDRNTGASLTVPEDGFHYQRIKELLFGEFKHGIAGQLRREDGDTPFWLGQVLVRGKGKTGGYHEKWLPVAPKVRNMLLTPTDRERLRKRADEWVRLAADARLKVLKPALLVLLQGAPDKPKLDDTRANPYLERFDAQVDRSFFAVLFEHAGANDEDATRIWQQRLSEWLEQAVAHASQAVPFSAARRLRAIAAAESRLFGAARKQLPLAWKDKTGAPT